MESSGKTKFQEFSVAISATLNSVLKSHLIRSDLNEDVAFGLYKPSCGKSRLTALIHEIILPENDDRVLRGNSVEVHSKYFKRACKMAVESQSGIVFMHSHPGPGWQGMSIDDVKTERSYAPNVESLTDLPLVGMTLGNDGVWSARYWENTNDWIEKNWAATVRVVGKELSVSYYDKLRPKPQWQEIYKRTITVWGELNHAKLARLRIGIIGLGSVGNIVAEALARMGIERFVLIDFDEAQLHNLDRLLGASRIDIGQLKVSIAHRQIQKAATASHTQIVPVPYGITEEEGYLNALDCDVLFSCVDRPWPRQVLNHIAYNHLIPVIDGGISVLFDSTNGKFSGADWQLQTVGPERPCLQCLGAFHPADVSTEQEGKFDDPSYLAGLADDHAFKRNENIFPFSCNLASFEVMQFIEMVTGIGETYYYGFQRYVYNVGLLRTNDSNVCVEGCFYSSGTAMGDFLYPAPFGFDHAANQARKRQA